ncbi:WecB/TagA/CpsF family glycosyltransferase [Bradyrhizobium icense]|uniref:WecB/TagA/CpsF family glycosyltransferase n=1 Tax=Bradyrhizobium icense TaxID=1274631 RepID=UPI0012EA0DBF
MVVSALVEHLSQHQLVGVQHGSADLNSPALLQRIRSARPYLLLVALGNPAHELRLTRNIDATGCTPGNTLGG